MMKREEHCTHPSQEWCDCDWCQLVRADEAKRKARNARRRERDQAMRDLGLVRVRGALGGVYWE